MEFMELSSLYGQSFTELTFCNHYPEMMATFDLFTLLLHVGSLFIEIPSVEVTLLLEPRAKEYISKCFFKP